MCTRNCAHGYLSYPKGRSWQKMLAIDFLTVIESLIVAKYLSLSKKCCVSQLPLHIDVTMWLSSEHRFVSRNDMCNFWYILLKGRSMPSPIHFLLSFYPLTGLQTEWWAIYNKETAKKQRSNEVWEPDSRHTQLLYEPWAAYVGIIIQKKTEYHPSKLLFWVILIKIKSALLLI